ncbi:MAG: FAD/NAD(P)-binding protein [Litorimonas sp.]
MKKVAVIGSGAAGAGVVLGLLSRSEQVEIHVFDAAEPMSSGLERDTDPRLWSDGRMAEIYAKTTKTNGYSIPLPKSYFGFTPKRVLASDKKRIWRSAYRGGLTNFWGGTMLPLAEEDFQDWPVKKSDLVDWYQRVCQIVGVSGQHDGLTEALDGFDPSNRPPIQIEPLITDFLTALNAVKVNAGVNRIALETRPEVQNHCIFCGECLIGCFKGAPFSTSSLFRKWSNEGSLASISSARVHSIDLESRVLTFEGPDGPTSTSESFDQIFLGAGCFGSTSIMMNTFAVKEATFEDSRVLNIPVMSSRLRTSGATRKGGFGLTHGLAVFKGATGKVVAQAQFYPTLPHFWRSALPSTLWSIAELFGQPLRKRVLWARAYLPSDSANTYTIRREDGEVEVTQSRKPAGDAKVERFLSSFKSHLKRSDFRMLSFLVRDGGSSSHYAAASPFRIGEGKVDEEFKIAPGVFAADSMAWPSAPAMSPTLTIMANAMRLAAAG